MGVKKKPSLDYTDRAVQEEILIRQRRDMWTREQIASLTKHFRLQPGMGLLDVGCGFGYCLRTYGPACMPGGRLVGMDRQPELLETAERLAGEEGLGNVASFVEGDICDMPLDDDSFDVVMAQVVLCHLDEPQRALDEMIRVARPGGCIAVFDNAVTGLDEGWNGLKKRSLRQHLQRLEEWLLWCRGRQRLGQGDWSLGAFIPGWMEARGLDDVDARMNEKVHWMAPPYRSPAQQSVLRHERERAADTAFDTIHWDNLADGIRAAGGDEAIVQRAIRADRSHRKRWHQAVNDGTAAYSFGGSFWCVWGFKPGR